MNDRERFVACVLGEPVDRPPFWLFWGPWGTTFQRWIDEGMPSHYAVRLVKAVREHDLARIDHEIEDMAGSMAAPGPELRLLQVAACWGLGKESRAAVFYDDVIDAEGVLQYYDSALEEWLRDRAAEVAAGEGPSYTPSDATKRDALRMEFHGRGVPGKFLLYFLEPKPVVHAAAVRVGELDDEVIAEIFANHTIDWYYCYAHEGGEEMLGPGTILFDFGVDPYGRVEFCSTRPGGDLRNPALRDCCCDAIEEMRFPIPDGGGIASERYKLTFPIKI